MALPELLANSPVIGERAAISTLNLELSEAGLEFEMVGELPASLKGPGQFHVILEKEILLCEGGTGKKVKVVTRGVEETTKKTHAIGVSVYVVLTKATLEELMQAKVDIFLVNGEKWKKPVHATQVTVICIGGGGGGGGGAHGKSGTICTGGGGGSGGAFAWGTFAAADLAAEIECTIPAQAAGGKGFETEKAGEIGAGPTATKFGTLLEAQGGNGGKGGEITGVAAKGGVSPKGMFEGNEGGTCAATGKAAVGLSTLSGGGGGGSGGGVTVTPTGENGGAAGLPVWSPLTAPAGGTGGTTGEAGKPGLETVPKWPGTGGGGGGGTSATAAGGKGGEGGTYGGGGGGGGATVTAAKFSGEGGKGGKAAVIVITK